MDTTPPQDALARSASLDRPGSLQRPDAFEEGSFWRKISRFAGRIGRTGVLQALTLYHTMRDPRTPARAKATIAGALGYLIVPLDVVPDVFLGVGYGDDLTALAFAAGVVALHVKEAHRAAARERLAAWFPRGVTATSGEPGPPR